jgi:hypothetical protein
MLSTIRFWATLYLAVRVRTIKGSITIRRYSVVLAANASGTDQMGAVAKGQRLSDTARQIIK